MRAFILAAALAAILAGPALAAQQKQADKADARVADRQAAYDADPSQKNADRLTAAQDRAARKHASCGC